MKSWATLLGCAALVSGGMILLRQHSVHERLATESTDLRARDQEAGRLRAELELRAKERVTNEELAALRADHEAVVRLRGEVEALEIREKTAAKTRELPTAAPAPSPAPAPKFPTDPDMVLAADWKNLGRGTPEAALETTVWAVANGDMDTLAATLQVDAKSRAKLEQSLAALPNDLRAQYGTPEQLLALMVSKDIPDGGMHILGPVQPRPDGMPDNFEVMQLKLQDTKGGMKKTVVMVQKVSAEWQVIVPPEVVNKYVRQLATKTGAVPPPAP